MNQQNTPIAQTSLKFETVLALLPWVPAGPVLDLGTGSGKWAMALADYGFDVTAVDCDPDKIAVLKLQVPQINWLAADIRSDLWSPDLHGPDKPHALYAALLCLNLFPFLPKSEHLTQLRRIKAALRPGGLLIFSGFSDEDPGANKLMASSQTGEVMPTGTISLEELRQVFSGWEPWLEYVGPLADDHPPHGPHQHGVVQVIYKKPETAQTATHWQKLPTLGAGLGWRHALSDLLEQDAVADFIEIMSDDFLDPQWDRFLLALSQRFAIIPHGVELSVGSLEGADLAYLEQIARIVARCDSPWWSDHLCYTQTSRFKTWSLNPLPCSEEALEWVVKNAKRAIQVVGKPLLLENPAYYWRPDLPFQFSDADFLSRVTQNADCGILLDVANLFGNAHNLGLDPYAFIDALPGERVIQIHLAGGRLHQNLLFDTHDHAVHSETWKLLDYALKHCGIKAISLERDDHYEDLQSLVGEVAQARHLMGVRS
jgi:uncharacterized protein (UPF0276 family)